VKQQRIVVVVEVQLIVQLAELVEEVGVVGLKL
jgi:hypothetical protein